MSEGVLARRKLTTRKSRAIRLYALGLAKALSAATDSFLSGPATLIVPFPQGGSSDAPAWQVVQRAGAHRGRRMIVESLAGAVGGIGTTRVGHAKPEG